MLIQFNVRNYKGFREEASLDFSATKYTEHAGHVTEIGTEKLLPAAVLFGANASGKTTILEAFACLQDAVLNGQLRNSLSPFANRKEYDDGTILEVYFMDEDEKVYCYGFAATTSGIYDEWLRAKAKRGRQYRDLLGRGEDECFAAGVSESKQKRLTEKLNPESLLVSILIEEGYEKVLPVKRFFENCVVLTFGWNPVIREEIVEEPYLVPYLASFDPGITGAEIRNHDLILHRGELEVSAMAESQGVIRMLGLYPILKNILRQGGVLLADNLNNGLHTLLVRNLLITFLNASTNPKHAQLVMTTQDAWMLSNHILRRDEVWFTAKDEQGKCSLYSLAELQDEEGIKVRKDENHEKNYMMGKYGAVPQLDYFRFLNDE